MDGTAQVYRDPDQAPVLEAGHTLRSVTEKISGIVLDDRTRTAWLGGFTVSFLLLMMLLFAITVLFAIGVGIWGVGIPIAWGFAIVSFVWWVGIGHAGTLISAMLLLLHQKVADFHQSHGRGDDDLRDYLRGDVLEQRGLSYIIVARLTLWLKREAAASLSGAPWTNITPLVNSTCNFSAGTARAALW